MIHRRICFFIYSALWGGIGALLLSKGIKFILESVAHPSSVSIAALLKNTTQDPQHHAAILLTLALFVGHLKGKYVLRKSALRQMNRLNGFKDGVPFKNIFSKGFFALMAIMMSLGFSLRFLPIPLELRGLIDCAIGMALIQGGVAFLRGSLFPTTHSNRL